MITNGKKEEIAKQVIKTLHSRFKNFPSDELNNRNAPFHEAFLKAFANKLEGKVESIPIFISLSSWAHGLSTTLGQTFFEKVAHKLSDGSKKGFTSDLRTSLKIKQSQQTVISDIITGLKNAQRSPNLEAENNLIFEIDNSLEKDSTDFTVDNYIEEDTLIEAIELKTVKPNSGIMKEEKLKILTAKAALKYKYPQKEIKYFLGFPFDPLSDSPTGSNKSNFMNYVIDIRKYFATSEILLANELWDKLSGQTGTMECILDIINNIAKPDFMEKFDFIKDIDNLFSNREKFIKTLFDWNLFNETKLYSDVDLLVDKCSVNKRNQRIFHQPIFNAVGDYNSERYSKLNGILS